MLTLTAIVFSFLCNWLHLVVSVSKILQIFALSFCYILKINETVTIVTIGSIAVCIVY